MKSLAGLTIGLDMDEVLADLHTPWIAWGNERFGTDHKEFTHWNAPTDWWGREAYEFFGGDGEVYRDGRILPYDLSVIRSVELLRRLGAEIRVVTSCIARTQMAKLGWLYQWDLIHSRDEFLPMSDKSNAPVDILVDDGVHNVQGFQKGLAVLMERPHNIEQRGKLLSIQHLDELPYVIRRHYKNTAENPESSDDR